MLIVYFVNANSFLIRNMLCENDMRLLCQIEKSSKICKICKKKYFDIENTSISCTFHSGRYIGAELSKHCGTKSGGTNKGLNLSWDCCDQGDPTATGCVKGRHVSYDDETIDFMMNKVW